MKDKKLQVFVSSTYTDLRDERQAAVEAILSSGNIPAGMELFAAGDESQMTVIERWIDESDVYLLILGGRYGSVENKTGKSYTHLEYEYALSKNKPLFAVVISDTALDEKVRTAGRTVIEQDRQNELKEFRSIVLGNLVKFWEDKKDIKIAVHETLAEFSYRKELVGWIRGDNAINSGILAEEIARLTKENADLRNKTNSQNSQQALYSGLTFEQLKNLLVKEKAHYASIPEIENCYQYILHFGKDIVREVRNVSGQEFVIFRNIETYKLVTDQGYDEPHYVFTADGHNFYLRALLEDSSTLA